MIDLAKVSKLYKPGQNEIHALDRVSLGIESGAYVALLGPSGSGKSTLLHVLGCLDRPTSGTYKLDGVDVKSLDRNELADLRNQKIGFVFQRFHLLPGMTALENVALPLRVAGLGSGPRRERARELLERVGLNDRSDHLPSELSGGQQQRVAIARALANRPNLLLADEPTGNLDSSSGQDIIRWLEELNREGRTLIVVTHDEQIAARAQRVIRLLDGSVVEDSDRD